jgi:uncharacterized sulfatase
LLAAAGAFAQPSPATKRLLERIKMFEKRIIRVAENFYTAIGYRVSANSMIVGEDGVIIIDPGQVPPVARQVRAEFEKINNKPVKAIIYTHGHGDHANGAPAYFEAGKGIQVWARQLRVGGKPQPGHGVDRRRAAVEHAGLRPAAGAEDRHRHRRSTGASAGPQRDAGWRAGTPLRRARPSVQPQEVEPKNTFSEDRKRLEIAGVTLDLVKAPGDTDDQLYVWLPDRRADVQRSGAQLHVVVFEPLPAAGPGRTANPALR